MAKVGGWGGARGTRETGRAEGQGAARCRTTPPPPPPTPTPGHRGLGTHEPPRSDAAQLSSHLHSFFHVLHVGVAVLDSVAQSVCRGRGAVQQKRTARARPCHRPSALASQAKCPQQRRQPANSGSSFPLPHRPTNNGTAAAQPPRASQVTGTCFRAPPLCLGLYRGLVGMRHGQLLRQAVDHFLPLLRKRAVRDLLNAGLRTGMGARGPFVRKAAGGRIGGCESGWAGLGGRGSGGYRGGGGKEGGCSREVGWEEGGIASQPRPTQRPREQEQLMS